MKKRVFAFLWILIASVSIMVTPIKALAGEFGCSASPSSFYRILTSSIATLYNIFPIELAGVPIEIVHLPTADSLGGSPICICVVGTPPVPRLGLTFGWWNPQAVIETNKAPYCFPSLGFGLTKNDGIKFMGEGTSTNENQGAKSPRTSHYVYMSGHYIKYPTIILLDVFTDVMCLNLFENGIDLFYMTEVDPIWRNDTLSTILNPEAILFANPVAQTACMADSAASIPGFPLDPLFWCMGTWGSSYPLAGNKSGQMNMAAAGLAARTIYRMTRMSLLWQTIGRSALCQPLPMPIWIKSQYSIYEGYPKLWPKRFPIGYPESIWGVAANPPIPKKDDNYVWFMYQHHQCCLF